jgi:DNA primase
MDIKDIKAQLTITAVLQHYGLKADRNNKLCCPFHDDKSPSMQIYPQTNTYCCFSANCNAGTGDAIQFIERKENCSKHEALKKATAMIEATGGAVLLIEQPKEKARPNTSILQTFFDYYKAGLHRSKKALSYLESRNLNYKKLEIAFNSGGLHVESKNHYLINDLVEAGLLKALPVNGHSVWAKDCIIFPLRDKENNIVSFYGRSILDIENARHFYLQNRTGLYPSYPTAATKKLILTECIIDAASLLQQDAIRTNYEILSLYGTNGLTDEHQEAIINLPGLEEIIFILDNDEAGAAATVKHSNTLQALLPDVKITAVTLPNKDVNDTLQAHNEEIFIDLLKDRKPLTFLFSIENKNDETTTNKELPQQSKLDTRNNELLIYDNCELYIEVLGGIKITGLDKMKVTLKVKHKEKVTMPQWYSLDLYNQAQREQTIQNVAENLEVSTQQTTNTFINLITELENHRLKKIEALQPKEKPQHEITQAQRTAAVNELKKSNLLNRTAEMIALTGIVGEASNSMIAYLVYCTRKQPVPLHIMFLGSSGSGKTYLQERISELIPTEDKIEITQITENALYYFKQDELKNKLILIEDLDGAMTVFYPLRELQTKRKITKTVTLKDSKGNLKTVTITVEGPVSVSGCTTKEKIYEDNANRCILLYTDQSREQDKRINEYQTKLSGGEINKERERQYKELFKNIQSVLRPIHIVNPFAKYIELPEQVFKPRRTMTLLLGFIEAVTFYHQYQREVKKDSNNQRYIETTIEDIEAAFNLLKDVLFSKSDELTKAARSFLEQVKVNGKSNFTAKEIRQQLRINPSNLKRYLIELERYGYIKGKGNRYRNYEYQIVSMEEYEQLKGSIDRHLQEILTTIKVSIKKG